MADPVRLIGAEGENHGVVSPRRALEMAQEAGLDLVEISPNADPPVCKVMDFGKYKYEEQKQPAEGDGPFIAGLVTYTISRGGNLNLWAGKRQAGFICSGGVCKYEPEFEGVEFFGVFRY